MAEVTQSSRSSVPGGQALTTAGNRGAVRSPYALFGRRLLANRMAVIGLAIVSFLVLVAIFAPLLAQGDPNEMLLTDRFIPPSSEHLLGTDEFGRDLLTRIIYGSRVSLRVGLISVGIALISGSLIGLLAGYFGGWFDMVSQRIIDVALAFPALILALAIMAVLGPNLRNVIIALGIGSIPVYTRVMRSEVLALRQADFVDAARAAGAGHLRLMLRHILPNALSSIVVISTLGIGSAILGSAGLSFIGIGAQPPTPEWGVMLATGRQYLAHEWWIATFPGIAIALTVLGFNLLGDGLRDALDPRTME